MGVMEKQGEEVEEVEEVDGGERHYTPSEAAMNCRIRREESGFPDLLVVFNVSMTATSTYRQWSKFLDLISRGAESRKDWISRS